MDTKAFWNISLNNKLVFKNPVWNASGMFMYGSEVVNIIDLSRLGAIVIKGITLASRNLKKTNRFIEIKKNYSYINAVGVENCGIHSFLEEKLPSIKKYKVPIILNLVGETELDYLNMLEILEDYSDIAAIELNLSCPNIIENPYFIESFDLIKSWVENFRKKSNHFLIAKIGPHMHNIKALGLILQDAGVDAISLINSIPAMDIDIEKRKSSLWKNFGGLTGPAIHPIALKMIFDLYQVIKIPIIGIGGIHDLKTAISSFLAGASVIQIGTAFSFNHNIHLDIMNGIEAYCQRHKIDSISDLVGQFESL